MAPRDDPPADRGDRPGAEAAPRQGRPGVGCGALQGLGRRLGAWSGGDPPPDRRAWRVHHRPAPGPRRGGWPDRPAPAGRVRGHQGGYRKPGREGTGDGRSSRRRVPCRARHEGHRSAPVLRRFELFWLAPHAARALPSTSFGARPGPAERPLGEAALATETKSSTALETFSREDRTFPPPKAFAAQANAKDPAIYERAAKDLEGFWAEQARTLTWRKPFDKVLEWEAPYAKWFLGGELNISENCLDRHVRAGKGSKVAYHWEGEPGDARTITYQDLLDETSRAANALRALGVRKGDRVAIYMPMIPELPAAMLACARIGAPFTVVFGGFSAEALSGRINDSEAQVLITADGGYRKVGIVPLKKNADEAIALTKGVEKVLVVRRTKQDVPWTDGRDVWWHEIVDRQKPECPAESLDSEHMP